MLGGGGRWRFYDNLSLFFGFFSSGCLYILYRISCYSLLLSLFYLYMCVSHMVGVIAPWVFIYGVL